MIILDSYITSPASFKNVYADCNNALSFFTDFWEHRNEFAQDMSPETIFYWDEQIKRAYRSISSIIRIFNEDGVLTSDEAIEELQRSFLTFSGIALPKEIIKSVIGTNNAERMIFACYSDAAALRRIFDRIV